MMTYIKYIIFSLIAFFGLLIGLGSWYTVDEGERAVILRNGAIIGISSPGLNFKFPFIDMIKEISIRQGSIVWEGNSSLQAYSKDQQPANISVSVNYHVPENEVENVYRTFTTLENLTTRVIIQKTPQAVKTVFGKFNAVTVIQERGLFNNEVLQAIQTSIDGPVIIDSVQITNIDFSKAYEDSVEARMMAEVEVQKRQQELAQKQIEAQITVTNAQAEADSQLAKAKANAEAIRIQGEATAQAIKARGFALINNPLLVELTKAEKWNGVLPTTVLPNNTIPFIDTLK